MSDVIARMNRFGTGIKPPISALADLQPFTGFNAVPAPNFSLHMPRDHFEVWRDDTYRRLVVRAARIVGRPLETNAQYQDAMRAWLATDIAIAHTYTKVEGEGLEELRGRFDILMKALRSFAFPFALDALILASIMLEDAVMPRCMTPSLVRNLHAHARAFLTGEKALADRVHASLAVLRTMSFLRTESQTLACVQAARAVAGGLTVHDTEINRGALSIMDGPVRRYVQRIGLADHEVVGELRDRLRLLVEAGETREIRERAQQTLDRFAPSRLVRQPTSSSMGIIVATKRPKKAR